MRPSFKLAATNGIAYSLTVAARAAMLAYDWPGNIRELMNAIDYGCALSTGGIVDIDDLPERFRLIGCGPSGGRTG